MGWVMVMGACAGCGRVFSFNAHKVPSIRINGIREPVCQLCIDRANEQRIGFPKIEVHPDAYKPMPEEEL